MCPYLAQAVRLRPARRQSRIKRIILAAIRGDGHARRVSEVGMEVEESPGPCV